MATGNVDWKKFEACDYMLKSKILYAYLCQGKTMKVVAETVLGDDDDYASFQISNITMAYGFSGRNSGFLSKYDVTIEDMIQFVKEYEDGCDSCEEVEQYFAQLKKDKTETNTQKKVLDLVCEEAFLAFCEAAPMTESEIVDVLLPDIRRRRPDLNYYADDTALVMFFRETLDNSINKIKLTQAISWASSICNYYGYLMNIHIAGSQEKASENGDIFRQYRNLVHRLKSEYMSTSRGINPILIRGQKLLEEGKYQEAYNCALEFSNCVSMYEQSSAEKEIVQLIRREFNNSKSDLQKEYEDLKWKLEALESGDTYKIVISNAQNLDIDELRKQVLWYEANL